MARSTIYCGIYQIINVVNGHSYVGSSRHIHQRWRWHRCALRRGVTHNIYLQRAWDKYGESSFRFSVLEECLPEMLRKREDHWMAVLKPQYNRTLTSFGNPDENTRQRMSDAHRGKVSNLWSPESRAKLSQRLLGHTVSDETKVKIRLARATQVMRGKRQPSHARVPITCEACGSVDNRRNTARFCGSCADSRDLASKRRYKDRIRASSLTAAE